MRDIPQAIEKQEEALAIAKEAQGNQDLSTFIEKDLKRLKNCTARFSKRNSSAGSTAHLARKLTIRNYN